MGCAIAAYFLNPTADKLSLTLSYFIINRLQCKSEVTSFHIPTSQSAVSWLQFMAMSESHYIRVGFYDEFKGYDTVLISVDIHGLLEMEDIFLKLSNGLSAFPFSDLKYLDKTYRINITAYNDVINIGMKQTESGNFEWRLTKEKWRQFREMLTAILHSTCVHQYLDTETGDIDLDSLQVVCSLDEYPLTFWQEQFSKCNG